MYSNSKNSLNALTPAAFTLTTYNPLSCKFYANFLRVFFTLTDPDVLLVIIIISVISTQVVNSILGLWEDQLTMKDKKSTTPGGVVVQQGL